jgi:hypothetical protein
VLTVVVGVIAAALVVGLGVLAPVPSRWSRLGLGQGTRHGVLFGLAATVSLLLLLVTLLGAGSSAAGGMLLLLVVALIVLMGLSALWSWLRLQISD